MRKLVWLTPSRYSCFWLLVVRCRAVVAYRKLQALRPAQGLFTIGQSVALSWVITGSPTTLSIDNGVGTCHGWQQSRDPDRFDDLHPHSYQVAAAP